MKPMKAVQESRKRLRRALVEAQDNLCAYCFEPMAPDTDQGSPLRATLDHVFSLRNGGTDATSVAVHSSCNRRKGHRPPTGCELLALDWVRQRVNASPRIKEIVRYALEVLGNLPSWARFGARKCGCLECRALDAKYPNDGYQLLLPIVRH